MHWLRHSDLWLFTMGIQGEAKTETKKLNGSQEAKGLLLEINIYTKTRRISFQILHQDKNIMRSSFNHCIETFGVNYRKSRELQGKTKDLETDKAKDPS